MSGILPPPPGAGEPPAEGAAAATGAPPAGPPPHPVRPSTRRMRTVGFVVALLLAFGFVGLVTAVEITSQPSFCGTCHIMKPYYQSWRHSSHRNIACVECHIAPGVTAEVRKKFEALSMVAKYFTGTYSQNPWTEVEDAACLRCHERRTLVGKMDLKGVQFDHQNHLSDLRRGKKLRCTSCHSQIVQGSHIAVTTTTCILCHFKGQQAGAGTARCTLCHQVPTRTYKVGDVTVNHADVAKFGMDCVSCHGRPKGGDGEVPRERCITCHNQPARLEKYGDTMLLHQKHVTEHKVDCMYCHLKIEHVEPVQAQTAAARIQGAAGNCQACHVTGHSPQLDLYTGTGGRGVPPMPSPMFEAGVRCEGCHFGLPGHAAAVNRASAISCMACHGAGYQVVFQGWMEGSARRAEALRRQLDATARAIPAGASQALDDAQANLALVAQGHGVHNIQYAYALLRRAHQDMNAARAAHGLAALPTPWPEPPYESPCFACHTGIENQRGQAFGRAYAHEAHVVRARIDCGTCHRRHEDKPAGEVVRFDASGCESCHHKKPLAACQTCHQGIESQKGMSFRGMFAHKVHLEDAGKTCADCHDLSTPAPSVKQAACKECHED